MKVLITGAKGQLGYDVVKRLEKSDIKCLGTDKDNFDITEEKQTKDFIVKFNPDVVVHCAAYTAVDKAEEEKDICYRINVIGTSHIAQSCEKINAKMVYISTDYVFDGEGDKPFETTCKPNPINYYGRTKYEGELEVQKYLEKFFIVRISWVFGSHGNNFVKTMLRLGKERKKLYVVADQVGSPTYTYDLAKLLVEMIQTDKYGIYHVTNDGYCSWYDFACEIFKQADIDVKVYPIKTEDYTTKAKRPKNSRLQKDSIYDYSRLQNWDAALSHYFKNMK